MNVAKKSILPGEHVIGSLMQAELRTPFVTLFGHTYTRLKAPAHILVRTDRELILAVEENQEAWSGSHKYGSIRTYIPLTKIAAVTWGDDGAQYMHVAIHLIGGEQIDLDFAAEQEGLRGTSPTGRCSSRLVRSLSPGYWQLACAAAQGIGGGAPVDRVVLSL